MICEKLSAVIANQTSNPKQAGATDAPEVFRQTSKSRSKSCRICEDFYAVWRKSGKHTLCRNDSVLTK